ncbi:universal stress protein UspA [Haloprofundus marisrubri]|uniref:Universal stress protein UspA n=1 Tax=Haloprofundus marisrubri TaxID=1514971 RepID=A0A0W1R5A0_9EURY|nr:universal stress protein [Haloprofundus marisrubri]KTG08301.1 universal stress protein UspA [Haloprofundus marisrubri]
MYDTILLPTDGSDGSRQAAAHAFDLARQYDATVHVLYVADTQRDSLTTVGTEVVDALESEGQEAVSKVVDSDVAHGVDIEEVVVQGHPDDEILAYVEDNAIDLVVMATHGRSGLGRYLLGSTTEKIVRSSPVPVFTVRVGEE